MSSNKYLSLLIMFVVVVIWGIAPVIAKSLLDNGSYSPVILLATRGLFGCLFTAVVLNKDFKNTTKSYWICIPAGLILAGAYIFQMIGLKYTTPAKNAFLENISCLFVPLFMFILVRKKPTWSDIVTAILCAFGSLILVGNGFNFSGFFKAQIGDLYSGIAGFFFGLELVITKIFAKGKIKSLFVFYQMVVMTVVCFIYAFIFEDISFNFEPRGILIIAFLGIVCTALCWVLRAKSFKNVSAIVGAAFVPISAIVATTISIALKMDEFNLNLLVGAIIIVFAILFGSIMDAINERKNKITAEAEST